MAWIVSNLLAARNSYLPAQCKASVVAMGTSWCCRNSLHITGLRQAIFDAVGGLLA
jgi:hypothetical protein